jgi:hypothetical protein
MLSRFALCFLLLTALPCSFASAQAWPAVESVDRQPLLANVKRVATALDSIGRPLTGEQQKRLGEIAGLEDDAKVLSAVQELFDPICLAAIHINAESRVKVIEGPVNKQLVQNGWRTFLVKVKNEAGINPALKCSSEQAKPQYIQSDFSADPPEEITMADVKDRWLDIALPDREPMKPTLSGLGLEYRVVQLYSRDVGKREATLAFDIGQGTQDLGFRNEVAFLFDCLAGVEVGVDVRDSSNPDDPGPMMVALEVRDDQGRVYPNPARRLAPDFFFHDQVYRQRGEKLSLPVGEFEVKISRGPEYLPVTKKLVVDDETPKVIRENLTRWIDPIDWNWYSGDHHIHAAGCSHYQNPTKGVGPDDMMRHVLGEDLKVGCVLSWGPCWYEQKLNFEGKPSLLSTPEYLMRYDVEVSGFPSSHAGHLCLLRLSEDDYPGTKKIEDWPSWTLPVLKWGKRQGGVVGYSHSGWGLTLPDYLPDGSRAKFQSSQFDPSAGGRAADRLPDYAMPRFDGIGANEYIVAVTQDCCDFISTVDTPAIWELNMWYHTLNCGFETRISGETDFPCIYGDRVGLGRVYVQLDPDQKLDFDAWVDGLKDGRSYCGDGLSHVVKFNASTESQSVRMGWPGSDGRVSQMVLEEPANVKFETSIAALLDETQTELGKSIAGRRLDMKPYWHIERSRVAGSRNVKAELIINGESVQQKEIVADGSVHEIDWNVKVEESSWIAVRILPSVHTNPIFVEVAGKPVRANRKSAQWCLEAVDVCWNSKKGQIDKDERDAAKKAYDEAAEIYSQILAECGEE